jgi:surface polysaccharide O-acyltransferase-like enzyme
MARAERLNGVDLLRGLAAYGVVVIHTLGAVPRSTSGNRLVGMCLGFVVPYFLAVSLYLTVGRLLVKGSQGFARDRIKRLIVPYLFWSVVFVAVRCVLYATSGRHEDLRQLLTSPLPLIFLGTASADLYFIPLLLVGEIIAVLLVAGFGERLRRPAFAWALAVLGLVASYFGIFRNALFLKDPSVSDAIRVPLTLAADALWTFPFVSVAILFQVPGVRRRIAGLSLPVACVLAVFAFGLDLMGSSGAIESVVPYPLWELVVAFSLLAFAIAVSPTIPSSRWLSSLAACTFGIYLMHPLVIEVVERIVIRLRVWHASEADAVPIALVAAVTFALSWGFVAMTLRLPIPARILYGERSRKNDPKTESHGDFTVSKGEPARSVDGS